MQTIRMLPHVAMKTNEIYLIKDQKGRVEYRVCNTMTDTNIVTINKKLPAKTTLLNNVIYRAY